MRQIIPLDFIAKANRDPNEKKDDSNEYCDAFRYLPKTDGNHTAYGTIVLSYSTATGDEATRLKTLMHEIGHSVSKAIADDPQYFQQLAGVRSCLRDQHTEGMPPGTKKSYEDVKAADPKTDGPYTEEDFADTVAGVSGQAVKGRNPWCQHLNLTNYRKQYVESKMQADDDDPHSASLFRLLNFEMMKKGKLPDSCKSYFKAVQFNEHFSSCFDLASPKGTTPTQPNRVVR
jgi:hypothetical protein